MGSKPRPRLKIPAGRGVGSGLAVDERGVAFLRSARRECEASLIMVMTRRDRSPCLSVFHAGIRTATGGRPYLAHSDYSVQVIRHDLPRVQF